LNSGVYDRRSRRLLRSMVSMMDILSGAVRLVVDVRQTVPTPVRPTADPKSVWVDDPSSGEHRLLNREEEHAFWAWAVIEVLRLTGVRVEELLELSHHSLVEYRLPSTGEIVPLLSIAPSKTDTGRLLVVSPELAAALEASSSARLPAPVVAPLGRPMGHLSNCSNQGRLPTTDRVEP